MPPHLHPRSRLTSSLFATTLFASFFVVALPHILPCPAPRVAYADGEMPNGTPPRRRRRRRCEGEKTEATKESQIVPEDNSNDCEEGGAQGRLSKPKRECPVPKPGGLVGEILGFRPGNENEGSSRPP